MWLVVICALAQLVVFVTAMWQYFGLSDSVTKLAFKLSWWLKRYQFLKRTLKGYRLACEFAGYANVTSGLMR